MKHRKLRFAWSLICGIVVSLLITLWVRSYKNYEGFGSAYGNVTSVQGTLVCNYFDFWYAVTHPPAGWYLDDGPAERYSNNAPIKRYPGVLLYRHKNGVPCLELQLWFLLILCSLSCVAPWQSWLRFSFSLRTLLLATTAVAVLLGLVVYLQ